MTECEIWEQLEGASTLRYREGQYRGPFPALSPLSYSGSRCSLSITILCVSGVVKVCAQWMKRSCSLRRLPILRYEKAGGGSSLCCFSRPSQQIVLPIRRAGVPVLRRPRGNLSLHDHKNTAYRRRRDCSIEMIPLKSASQSDGGWLQLARFPHLSEHDPPITGRPTTRRIARVGRDRPRYSLFYGQYVPSADRVLTSLLRSFSSPGGCGP